ncbi:MAG: ISAs1 family transposase [Thiotrichaceae bacterium]|nr:ISAs1 family transposase [Thiotrichaceae bacterium]
MIAGADGWVAVSSYGRAKEKWLTEILDLENRIPSHDIFGHVFSMINIEQFSECFSRWVKELSALSKGEIISLNGK